MVPFQIIKNLESTSGDSQLLFLDHSFFLLLEVYRIKGGWQAPNVQFRVTWPWVFHLFSFQWWLWCSHNGGGAEPVLIGMCSTTWAIFLAPHPFWDTRKEGANESNISQAHNLWYFIMERNLWGLGDEAKGYCTKHAGGSLPSSIIPWASPMELKNKPTHKKKPIVDTRGS